MSELIVSKSNLNTIQQAVDIAQPGDTIIIRPGVYRERGRVFNRPGTEENPIKLIGDGDVTIVPCETISDWSAEGGGLARARAPVSAKPDWTCLWILGEEKPMQAVANLDSIKEATQYWYDPAVGDFWVLEAMKDVEMQAWGENCTALDIRYSDWIQVENLIFEYCRWGLNMGTSSSSTLLPTRQIKASACHARYISERGMNFLAGPDTPSEDFLLQDGTVKYVHPSHPSINGHGIKVSQDVVGQFGNRMTVKNMDVSKCYYAGIQCSNGWNNVTVDGCVVHENSLRGQNQAGGVRFGTTQNFVLRNCDIFGNPQFGMEIADGASGLVYKNKFHGMTLAVQWTAPQKYVKFHDNEFLGFAGQWKQIQALGVFDMIGNKMS
jgi:hypothetical protein